MAKSLRAFSKSLILVVALVLVPAGTLFAQESPFTAAAVKSALIEPVSPSPLLQRSEPTERVHRFWDRNNRILFVAVGTMAAVDFCVTRANLASGGKELNPVANVFAGSTAGLAVNFAGETAGSIAISYLFHRTGHHKLERITSFVNIGTSAGAVGFGLAHR